MTITRNRWALIKDKTEIFCGDTKNHFFKNINDLKTASIKTYASRENAERAYEFYCKYKKIKIDNAVKVVEIVETLQSIASV